MVAYFSGEQIFSTTEILRTFCPSATKFGTIRRLANRNLLLEFRELWSGGHDTMRRHASVLHWHTCKVFFRQLSYNLPIVLVFFLITALTED